MIDIDDSEEDGMGDYGSEMFAYMREREEEFVVEDEPEEDWHKTDK